MNDKFRYLEDISIADLAFEAKGNTIEELFNNCALAVSNAMILNLESVENKITKNIEIENENLDLLLFNFLQEIIFYKDSEMLVFSKYEIKIDFKEKYYLKAKMYGEKIDLNKHKLGVDVKAVTMHMFEIKKEKNYWLARVVLDV